MGPGVRQVRLRSGEVVSGVERSLVVSGVGYEDLRQLGAAPVEDTDMADALHQLGLCAARECVQRLVARVARAHARAHFDQLMIGEGAVEFVDDAIGEPCVAEHDYGVQRMRQAPQVFLLSLRKCHARIIVAEQHA